jgi:hypothetical protein
MAVADRRITTSKRRFLREATYGCRRRFLMSQCAATPAVGRFGYSCWPLPVSSHVRGIDGLALVSSDSARISRPHGAIVECLDPVEGAR